MNHLANIPQVKDTGWQQLCTFYSEKTCFKENLTINAVQIVKAGN